MKYTVVIEQAVPEEKRPQLQQLLAERFSLTPEQAQKLAARKGGRLMKPTGHERASILLEIYREIGGDVHLEEVAETPTTTPSAPSAIPTIAPVTGRPLHASEFDQDALTLPTASAPANIPMPSDWSSTSTTGDFWSSMGSTSGLGSGTLTTDLQGSALPQIGAKDMGQSKTLVGSSVQKPVELSDIASSNLDTGWADFSSLSVGPTEPEKPVTTLSNPDPDTIIQTSSLPPEAAEPQMAQRQPLAQRLTLPVMVPLALLTALSLLTTGISMQKARIELLNTNARVVATTLGQTLSSDRKIATQQLENLVKDDNGASFVQVRYPDGTTIARAQNMSTAADTSKWVDKNPNGGNSGLYQIEEVGVYGSGPNHIIKSNSNDKNGLVYSIAVGTPNHGGNPLLALLPVLLGGLLTMALGWWLAQQAAQRIVQPITRLVQAADAISMGDLRQSVTPEANDEVGDLALALERMRLSLDAAMERLRRRRAKG